MVSRIPAPIRHMLLVVLAAALTAAAELAPSLNIPTAWLPFVTAGIAYALAWITPLVQSYGAGSGPKFQPPVEGVQDAA
jgi:hypothetical protein